MTPPSADRPPERAARCEPGSLAVVTDSCDPEIASVLDALEELAGPMAEIAPGDALRLREVTDQSLGWMARQAGRSSPDVRFAEHETRSEDGETIALRWYERRDSAPGAAVVYAHGGGMVSGSLDLYHVVVAEHVLTTGVPFLAVEYRLAPEVSGTRPVQDVFAGLGWLREHAAELGVDPDRIAVMGDSAGGGLAAAVSILARERGGPAIAKQLLIFPMLDDRNTVPDPHIEPYAAWTYDDNTTAWQALLGARAGGPDVPAHAAPARLTDATGLPPAYIEVGQLDIFRDEDLAYALVLSRGGVPVELNLTPGVPHEYDAIAHQSDAAHRAMATRIRILRSV